MIPLAGVLKDQPGRAIIFIICMSVRGWVGQSRKSLLEDGGYPVGNGRGQDDTLTSFLRVCPHQISPQLMLLTVAVQEYIGFTIENV